MIKGLLKGFSKEKQEEYNLTPDLFDVYSYLETYYKIQLLISAISSFSFLNSLFKAIIFLL